MGETNTLFLMTITNDGFVTVNTDLMNGLPYLAKYKLESLGKNAYKLYLYPANVKATSNGGGTTVSEDPIKRNFIIYMDSKNSFDIVFFDDKLQRRDFKMQRS